MSLLSSQTLQIAKGMDQEEVPAPLFPSLYPKGVDLGTVCIPSPYADNSQREMSFYCPSGPENPAMAPAFSQSVFWSSHNTHATPTLSLHCPSAVPYSEPQIHAAWADSKPHTMGRSRWWWRPFLAFLIYTKAPLNAQIWLDKRYWLDTLNFCNFKILSWT